MGQRLGQQREALSAIVHHFSQEQDHVGILRDAQYITSRGAITRSKVVEVDAVRDRFHAKPAKDRALPSDLPEPPARGHDTKLPRIEPLEYRTLPVPYLSGQILWVA